MRTLLGGVALLAIIAAPAMAETRYDRKLEQAVVEIVAGKMGNIRGGFSYKQVPQLVVVPDVPAAPVESSPKQASGGAGDGLTPAVEREVSRTIF